jgi:hypothetical protein
MLSALNWKRLPTTSPSSGAINAVLDAIFTALSSATYYNGDARTVGAGSAWTVSRFQAAGTTEAVYATPPSASIAGCRAIFAGAAGAKTPTMASPDTYIASCVLAAVQKGAGAFTTWDGATPFTNSGFFGYWRGFHAAGSTAGNIVIYESQEALAVFIENTLGAVTGVFVGCFVDPGTTLLSDAETDGRLYGVLTSGSTSGIPSAFWTSTTSWLSHSASNGAVHAGCFNPGLTTTSNVDVFTLGTAPTATNLVTRSGAPALLPFVWVEEGGAGRTIGRAREMYIIRDGLLREVLAQSGTTIAYVASGSSGAAQDAIAFGA